MTKRYGAYVGTPLQTVPPRQVDKAYPRTIDQVMVRDFIALAAAPANDTVSLGLFGWEAVLDPISSVVYFDALGANTTLSVGDITYPTALVNAQDTHTAAGSVLLSANLGKDLWLAPLWKALGYASLAAAQAVGAKCELLAKVGVAAATGNVVWQVKGQPRI